MSKRVDSIGIDYYETEVGDEVVFRTVEGEIVERDLRYPMELLQQIAAGLNQCERARVGTVVVSLLNGKGEQFDFTVPQVLDTIANDLYWDERGNWADARIARVRVL